MSAGGVRASGRWRAQTSALSGPRAGVRVELLANGASPSWREVAIAWRDDADMRALFVETLAGAPFDAYFWETCPVVGPCAPTTPYEQVLMDAPALSRVIANPAPFATQLAGQERVATFENLGRDATLVAPTARPGAPLAAYAHLASFVRAAPADQVDALLVSLGRAVLARLDVARPLWVSTSGLGVHWLHVRLDDSPKYVSYPPFRAAP